MKAGDCIEWKGKQLWLTYDPELEQDDHPYFYTEATDQDDGEEGLRYEIEWSAHWEGDGTGEVDADDWNNFVVSEVRK